MKIVIISFLFCALLVIPQFQSNVEAACEPDEYKYACVKKKNGQFRLVCEDSDCNPSEYPVEYEIKDDGELEVDMCWTNPDCSLKLDLNTDDDLFLVIGSEICGDVERHVYGSGSSISGQNRIGLSFTGTGDPSHETKVFVLDLPGTGGLCDANNASCCDPSIDVCDGEPPYAYTPIECSE